ATRTRRLHIGVSRGGIGGLLGRDRRRIIIAVAAVPIVIIPEGYDQAADTVAVRESTGEAIAAEASAAQAATDATAPHGTDEVRAAKAPAHASAPMTGSAATARSGVGRDSGTSQ